MGEDKLFGNALTHLIYRVLLLDSTNELTSSEIGAKIMEIAEIKYTGANYNQFIHRLRLRLKEMSELNNGVERIKYQTELKTTYYKYKIKTKS